MDWFRLMIENFFRLPVQIKKELVGLSIDNAQNQSNFVDLIKIQNKSTTLKYVQFLFPLIKDIEQNYCDKISKKKEIHENE